MDGQTEGMRAGFSQWDKRRLLTTLGQMLWMGKCR